MSSSRRRKRESYVAGEKGRNRVRLYPHPQYGTLYLEYYDEAGVKRRVALGHDDLTKGKIAANELAAALLKHEGPSNEQLTLRTLFDNYEREVTPTKSASKQAHDKRTRKLFEGSWGSNSAVKNLDRRDWDRFIQQRRAGALHHGGDDRKVKGVRDRIVEYDLRFLLAVCNWAETVRVNGQQLLERNPFRGFPLPVEVNPKRAVVTDEEFGRLTVAAKELATLAKSPTRKGRENRKRPWRDYELYLAHETGHRCSAIARLRWSDVDLEKGQVTWRAEFDKIGVEHTVPLSVAATTALKRAADEVRAARRETGAIKDGWVFPSPTDPEQPVRRDVLRDAWQKLEKAAKLERIPGRGWHSLRRKFATDLKHEPLADLCSLGGWKDHNTILKCYMRPDEETMRTALERRAEKNAAAG
jgi:integrase